MVQSELMLQEAQRLESLAKAAAKTPPLGAARAMIERGEQIIVLRMAFTLVHQQASDYPPCHISLFDIPL